MNIGIYIHIYIQLHPVIYAIKKPKTPIGNIFGLHFSVSLIIQITGGKKHFYYCTYRKRNALEKCVLQNFITFIFLI